MPPMPRRDTRDALLAHGYRLFMERGFGDTGLQDLLRAAGVPKGSFYHHFPSKEAFGLAVLEAYLATIDGRLDGHLAAPGVAPIRRLRGFFTEWGEIAGAAEPGGGCLAGKLAQEQAGRSEAFRDRLAEAFESWRGRIAATLREAQDDGALAAGWDADLLAGFILDCWQGALLRGKTARSAEPLDAFMTVVFGAILAS